MTFAYPVSPWVLAALMALAIALAISAYRRTAPGLVGGRRAVLVSLRALVFIALILFLLRPVVPALPTNTDSLVAIVIDTSRSMGLRDGAGETRLARAVAFARDRLVPELSQRFRVEVLAGGRRIDPTQIGSLVADGAQTDLRRALDAVADRFADQRLAGILLISDGAETVHHSADDTPAAERVRVVTVGIGAPVAFDREVRSVAVGPSMLDGSLVDLTVTAVAHGIRPAMRLRLLQNGRVLELKELPRAADGSPLQHVFTIAPDRTVPAVYRVELDADPQELTPENNRVDVLVPPPGRRRRILMIEGAPGFEHTFLKRAWQQDTSLEVDSVVRKGQDDTARDTFYVQAAASRSAALTTGFPPTAEALYTYDTVVLANVDLEAFSREQLEALASFVGERGGGLLALGARTLSAAGLRGLTLEQVLPVELSEREGGLARASVSTGGEQLKVALTASGEHHPLMRLSPAADDMRRRWAGLPALAGVAPLGGPRPGASVLAITAGVTGTAVPLVAVQRFGRGRAMVFAGEASWRWKMLMPASDRSFEVFWRQAVRWLGGEAPDPVTVTAPSGVPAGGTVHLSATARDSAFRPAPEAIVESHVTRPDGTRMPVTLSAASSRDGRHGGSFVASQPGLYRVTVSARQRNAPLGAADHLLLAGGVDPEFIDPGLNEAVLRRIAQSSGGRYVRPAQARNAADWFSESVQARNPELRDLWHSAWSFLVIVALLSGEWVLRRRWGLR